MEGTGTDIVVLAGGAGSRLGPDLGRVPKALLPVAGKPFTVWQALEIARAYPAINRILYSVRAIQAPLFHDIFGRIPISAHTVSEESPRGTGGAILNVLAQKGALRLSDPFLVINGDVLFPMAIDGLLSSARRYGASMQGIWANDLSRFGAIASDGMRVTSFAGNQRGAGIMNAGLYAFTRQSLDAWPNRLCSFETDIAPKLAAAGQLGLIETAGPFIDIGTPESYGRAGRFIEALQTQAKINITGAI